MWVLFSSETLAVIVDIGDGVFVESTLSGPITDLNILCPEIFEFVLVFLSLLSDFFELSA